MDESIGYRFWKNLDLCKKSRSLTEIAKELSLNYNNLLDQRTSNRLPRLEIAYSLAEALGVSVEYLLTGKERDSFPPRIQTIAIRCLSASEEDLALIERVLRIEAEKKPEGSEALA